MPGREALPVYLPHNEPYLGNELLLAFDKSIPSALTVHANIGRSTFEGPLTPLQVAATEVIPQGISLALSIRELVRQAYLYPAAVLIRPLFERTGTIHYLQQHPNAVAAWRAGWPKQSQPSLQELLELLHPARPTSDHDVLRTLMNKLIHSDPAGSVYNMIRRTDGTPVFSSGKMLDQHGLCNAVCAAGRCYLLQLTTVAKVVFPDAA